MRVRTHRSLLVTMSAVALLALTACGGSSSATSDGTAAAPSSTAASSAVSAAGSAPAGAPDFAAFRSCMEDNGVTLPDMGQPPAGAQNGAPPSGMPAGAPPSGGPGAGGLPGGLPDGVDQATYDAATKACADLAPQGGPGRGATGIDASALQAFKTCLTDHDVTIPDGDNWIATLDRRDATVAAAMKTCAPLMPTAPAPAASATPSSG
jgi:hypothetical protein